MNVCKRSGEIVPFNQEKIVNAIIKAGQSTGEFDIPVAYKLEKSITHNLLHQFSQSSTVPIESIQDGVEEVLIINKYYKTARSYIRYREQHRILRENANTHVSVLTSMTEYLNRADWRVKANANQGYSLGGLILNSSGKMTANYWLSAVYPPLASQAHRDGDIHIGDLDILAGYCSGWSLRALLEEGFNGVDRKVSSKPPKHLTSAISQMVNFLGTLQNEWAGAQAFSGFDTYLAPFIRVDNLPYPTVKQGVQEFVFNMNVPSRWGSQCVDTSTECLTADGWKTYNQLNIGDMLCTFNMETHNTEMKPIQRVNISEYDGNLIELKNRKITQWVTPNHRVIRRLFNSVPKYVVETASELKNFLTPPVLPLAMPITDRQGIPMSSNEIKLLAWVLSDASIEKVKDRIRIFQSKPQYIEDIRNLLIEMGVPFKEKIRPTKGTYFSKDVTLNKERLPNTQFSIYGDTARKYKNYTNCNRNQVPTEFKKYATLEQINIFITEYIKADGNGGGKEIRKKIYKKSVEMVNDLQEILTLAGYATTAKINDKSGVSTIVLYEEPTCAITHVTEVPYNGIVWCPTTENGTFVARRNGTVFITGNSPFSNITLDTIVPEDVAWQNPKIGGKEVEFTYGDLQVEMDMINKAFMEVMLEGDAQNRPFAFPIPTYNITKNFQWNHPNTDLLFEMTAKYGTPYFQNFINSDLNPKDVRSMCPIGGDEYVLIQSDRYTHSELASIKNLTEGKLYQVYSCGQYISGVFNKYSNKTMKTISLANHHTLSTSTDHANFVAFKNDDGTISTSTLPTSELTSQMYLPYSLTPYDGDGGIAELGYLVGCYAGDGSIYDNIVTFSLNDTKKIPVLQKIQEIVLKYFGNTTTVSQNNEKHLVTLRVPSQAVVGLCQEFVKGQGTNKYYSHKLYDMSTEFRKAVVEGHYATDGGNRNRIYTSSKEMVMSLNLLAATLGTTTAITCDNRDGRYSENTNYGVLFYQLNRESYGDVWFKHAGYLWMKITSIDDNPSHTGYCFAITEEFTPIFTVATTGIVTHNCRLQLDMRELLIKGNGLFGSGENTGSIGVATLNMARIGYRTKGDKEAFYTEMNKLMGYCRDVLELKRKMVTRWYEMGLYPYTKRYLKSFNTYFSTIGVNGMNECILNFTNGEHSIADEWGHAFAKEVLTTLRQRMVEFQEETEHLYNCEATPGESLTYRFARLDKKLYPDIIQAGTEEAPYYTNSSQLPVDLDIDLFEALKHQEPLQQSYSGGTVFHIFLGERMPSAKSCKALVKKVLTKFKIPYITITPSYCHDKETEVLTNNGWKFFKDLDKSEKVMTLNSDTNTMEFKTPTAWIKIPYNGKMLSLIGRHINMVVTPNHYMYVSGVNYRRKDKITGKVIQSPKKPILKQAIDLTADNKIPRCGFLWSGKEEEFFNLPIISTPHFNQTIIKQIPMDLWLKFFGIWIAEGTVNGSRSDYKDPHSYRVVISQSHKSNYYNEIESMLKEFPIPYMKTDRCFTIYNKQLWEYLKQFGNSHTKYIPEELKNLSTRQLSLLYQWYYIGDGSKTGSNVCTYSKSNKLNNDFQEICWRMGLNTSLKNNRLAVLKIKNTYVNDIPMKTIDYNDFVYCVDVPNHIICTRRNGFIVFSGNSICPTHGYIAGGHKYCPQCDDNLIQDKLGEKCK